MPASRHRRRRRQGRRRISAGESCSGVPFSRRNARLGGSVSSSPPLCLRVRYRRKPPPAIVDREEVVVFLIRLLALFDCVKLCGGGGWWFVQSFGFLFCVFSDCNACYIIVDSEFSRWFFSMLLDCQFRVIFLMWKEKVVCVCFLLLSVNSWWCLDHFVCCCLIVIFTRIRLCYCIGM